MMQLSVHLRASDVDDPARTPVDDGTPAPRGPWAIEPAAANSQTPETDTNRALAACLYETLSEELKGIETLGAEVKDLSVGLTVFPSFLDGNTEVLLAWTVTDLEIRTFYTPQGGYRSRKPVEGCRFTDGRTPRGQLRE